MWYLADSNPAARGANFLDDSGQRQVIDDIMTIKITA
jgi:hypothetical protein